MAKTEIELLNHITAEQVIKCVTVDQYAEAIQQLTLLSHRNLHAFNHCIETLVADDVITNSAFKLRIALFLSEQKLNEQKIEEAQAIVKHTIAQSIAGNQNQVLILAKLQQAVLNLYLKKPEESVAIFGQCELLAQAINDIETNIQIAVYGYHFYSETDTNKAGEYIYKALNLSKQHKEIYWQAYSLMHLGTLNTILNNNDVALNFYAESYTLFQQLQLNISMADNLMCQFNIYYRKKEFDKAIACLHDAIALTNNCGWDHKIAICYGNLSTVYLQLSKFEEAKQAAEKDIELSNKLNNLYNVGLATYRLGRIEAALGKNAQAIKLMNESIALRKNRISNNQLVQVYQHLFELYAQTGDYKNAFEIQSNFMQLKFEILNTEKTKENEAQRAKYEAEKREAELCEARLLQTESELKALKAQMNPHFIFNALNSIQEIFFLGDKRLANKHLSRFSQLMRSILKASGRKTITLQEEINMLEEYLSLEALRFGNSFQYKIDIDNNVDTYTLDVPPMIIQPFIENAMKHGLLHKEGEQQISIHFTFDETKNVIEATVADNGIGRKASAIINQHRSNHESFSTVATLKRFEILNQSSSEKFSFQYFDIEDENAIALGTTVVIALPVVE